MAPSKADIARLPTYDKLTIDLVAAHAHSIAGDYCEQVYFILKLIDCTSRNMLHDGIIVRLLAQNREWAKTVEETDPGFLERLAQKQEPKVCDSACSFLAVFRGVDGVML